MTTMQDWFDKYGESHQNHTNKLIHWICVPSIFFSLVGLLSLIPLGIQNNSESGLMSYAHIGTVLILFGMLFFIRKSFSIALGMAIVSGVILWIVNMLNQRWGGDAWIVYLAIFVTAWIGQFIGHKVEGAKPSFFDDLKFLMIGPAWLLHFIYKKIGIPV